MKNTLLQKYDSAKKLYDMEKKKRDEMKDLAKVEAYKNWRLEEEKKGRAQDEHSKSLVKKMMDSVREAEPNPVIKSMCAVIGNLDSMCKKKYFFLNIEVINCILSSFI